MSESASEAGQNAREWWVAALLDQQTSAHPIFGNSIRVAVDDDVVTLTGTVTSKDDAEQLEREALAIDTVAHVVNRLTVPDEPLKYHAQTVLALFPDVDAAKLAQQAISNWTLHEDNPAELFERATDAQDFLRERAHAAGLDADQIDQYLHALDAGKVLVVDSVPEDDALRLISALEGSRAELVRTFPPEPKTVESI